MRSVCLSAFIVCLLSGCTGMNSSINTVQLSGEVSPFPKHYQSAAARAVAGRAAAASLEVSRPKLTVGASIMDPQRWFVCVRGLAPEAPPPVTTKLPWDAVQVPEYLLVILFNGERASPLKGSYQAELCRDASFEPLTAKIEPGW